MRPGRDRKGCSGRMACIRDNGTYVVTGLGLGMLT